MVPVLLASASASAGLVSAAGGVSWNTLPSEPNFAAAVEYTQWWSTTNTTGIADHNVALDGASIAPTIASLATAIANGDSPELVGVGQVLLGGGLGEPNCGNCELTFSFGGLYFDGIQTVGTGAFAPDGNGGFVEIMADVPVINSQDSWLNIYIDYQANEFDEGAVVDEASANSEGAEAVDGTLWLSAQNELFEYTPDGSSGAEPLSVGSSSFVSNIIGGIAQFNIESNFFQNMYDVDAFGLTSSFVKSDGTIANYSDRGTGNFAAQTVSEPGTMALFGLGLLGLAGVARRKA